MTLAIKNIAKGEEIFASYGYNYWFSRSQQKKMDTGAHQMELGTATTVTIAKKLHSSSATTKNDRMVKKGMKRTATK